MARYASGEFVQEVSNLIETITPFKQGDGNYKKCLDYTLSMLFNHTYPDTYKAQVRNDLEALIEKFLINADHSRARDLRRLAEKFFELAENMGREGKQNMMQVARFMILMNGFSHLRDRSSSMAFAEEDEVEEEFDWHAYLKEGIEIDSDVGRGSSDESEWSELSEDETVLRKSEAISTSHEDVTENSSDLMTSVEVSMSSTLQIHSKTESIEDVVNDSWKARKPGYKTSQIVVNQRYPAPKLALLCSSNPALRILSEHTVIREVIMALRDHRACGLVFKREQNHKYSVMGDVTVCSVSPEMFRSILGSVTPILTILSRLHSFVEGMLPNSLENELQYPPKTYQAYATGLQLLFEKQNAFLLNLELKVKAQDDIMTIHTFLDCLQPWFKFVSEVFRVHKRAVFENYDIQQYWICSSKLLSVLWSEAEQATTHEMLATFFSLFLASLRPFLEITESWFKCGSLDDHLEEYLISGEIAEAENTLDGDYVLQPYEQSLKDIGVTPLPLLKVLATKGLTVGRSICLLRGLDCMDLVPRSNHQESLYEELISRLKSTLLSSGVQEDTLACPAVVSEDNQLPICPSKLDNLEQNTIDFLLSTCDVNLLEAYGDVIVPPQPHGSESSHSADERFEFGISEFPFKSSEICTVQSLNHTICEILQQLLDSRVQNLGKLAKDLLKDKCQISCHLGAMQNVAFFEIFTMQEFCSFLIEEVSKDENWHGWANWVLLTNRLQVCLSEQHLEWSHLFSVKVAGDYSADLLSEITEGFPLMQLINRLSVEYRMEWPTNLVLTTENMRMYNDVFRFFLKIKCALSSLQRLCLNESYEVFCGAEDMSRRLLVLRSWVLFLLRTIQEHMLSHILLDLKSHLDAKLLHAVDFHSALEAHDHFVRRAHFSCLLSKGHFSAQEHLMEVVSHAMMICNAFTSGQIEQGVVDNMEMKFNLAYNFLTTFFDLVLRSSNSVHLTGICVALNDKAPNF